MARNSAPTSNSTENNKRTGSSSKTVRRRTKKTQLIGMLSHKDGSTISAISEALGWQPHTTRAAITGLRKSGHHVETAKPANGGTGLIYRIVAKPDAPANNSGNSEAAQ